MSTEDVTEERFWMLFVNGRGGATHKHPTREEAIVEAERLLPSANGAKIYLLEAREYIVSGTPPVDHHFLL